MRSIEIRRQALAQISKPKLEDYLANCDKRTLDLVASFQRAMVEDLVGKTLAAARACDVATLFVTGGVAANQRIAQHVRAGRRAGRLARIFSLAAALHRQRRHDCGCGLSQISGRRFCCDGFFRRGGSAVALVSSFECLKLTSLICQLPSSCPPPAHGFSPSPHPGPFPAGLRCRYLCRWRSWRVFPFRRSRWRGPQQ